MAKSKKEIAVVPQKEWAVAEYKGFHDGLAAMRKKNEAAKFNYDDPKERKEAKSHLYALRQTKQVVDKVRLKAGEDLRDKLKEVNTQGNDIIAEIEGMIEHHDKHIREAEEKEKARIDVIQYRITGFRKYQDCRGLSSSELKTHLQALSEIVVDDFFAEFKLDALAAVNVAKERMTGELEVAIQREKDAEELAELRRQQEEQAQKDREAAIAAQAQRQAEEKAESDRLEAARREERLKADKERLEKEAKEAAEKAERDKAVAAQKAEEDKAAAVEKERKRIADEQEEERKAEEAREANKRHQKKIHGGIIAGLAVLGVDEETAKAIIVAIRTKEIPDIEIKY